ncbi:alpha/beta hydrolase [Erythrobacter sp. BLCC-B19]|uniref:alpha/beta hydrolase n=1 Tax=Erythrobacter sp. BLCC-B19 TaxID=3025315 RepID=UPI0023624F4A|nr:alpha/beta hydrolase [Erythrobacter sp. BLCC-B19]WDA41400.1 alpha/beta hydrolase [Erythrobacter sp. BLCC-B19]
MTDTPLGTVSDAAELRARARTVFANLGRLAGPNAIDEQRMIELGGLTQHIHLRGQDRDAPLLLFLHGGPNGHISDVAWAYQRGWEDFFVVVNWDQRGCGRSFGSPDDQARIAGTLNRAQYRADAIALIEHLLAEFGRERLVLVGQSWGTVLALEVAKARPDLLDVAVLQGLSANWLASADRVYHWYLAEAEKRGDAAEVARLKAVGPIPAADDPALTEWPMKFGLPIPDRNSWYNLRGDGDGWGPRMDMLRFLSPDLAPENYAADARRLAEDGETLFARHKEAMTSVAPWDARRDVGTRFEVPIVVMQGMHDWQTSYDLALEYFGTIDAPWKKWIAFPHAAHVLNLEQPGLSVVSLVNDVLPATRGEVPAGAERRAA